MKDKEVIEEVIDFLKKALIEEQNNPEENIKEKKRNERKKLKTELTYIEYIASLPPITTGQFLKRFKELGYRYNRFIKEANENSIFISKSIDFQQIFYYMTIIKNNRELHAIIDKAEKEMMELEDILKTTKITTNEIIKEFKNNKTK